jgi:hypothetical protein
MLVNCYYKRLVNDSNGAEKSKTAALKSRILIPTQGLDAKKHFSASRGAKYFS